MTTDDDVRTFADLPERFLERLLKGEAEPAFQLLPPLNDRDRDALQESVAERGIRVALELDADGRLLDGHHRLEVARELELEPEKIPVSLRDDLQGEEDALEYVLEVNLGRRHLTQEDRQQVARALRARGWSLRRIADHVGVSHTTIRRDLDDPDGTNVPPDDGSDGPKIIEGRDGKRYPASPSSGSCSESLGSGEQTRLPAHGQSRNRRPMSTHNGSSENGDGNTRAPGSVSPDSDAGEGEHRDLVDDLQDARACLYRGCLLAREERPELRERIENLAHQVSDLVDELLGTPDGARGIRL